MNVSLTFGAIRTNCFPQELVKRKDSDLDFKTWIIYLLHSCCSSFVIKRGGVTSLTVLSSLVASPFRALRAFLAKQPHLLNTLTPWTGVEGFCLMKTIASEYHIFVLLLFCYMTEIQKKGFSSFQNTDTLLDAKNFLLFNNGNKKIVYCYPEIPRWLHSLLR